MSMQEISAEERATTAPPDVHPEVAAAAALAGSPGTVVKSRRRREWRVRGLLPLVVLLAMWQIFGDAESLSFPAPGEWVTAIRNLNERGRLWEPMRTTLGNFAGSFVAITLIGISLGLVIGSSRLLVRATSPVLDFMRSLPGPVIVPIGALIFGFGRTMAVVTVTAAVVWPVLLGTIAARRAMSPARLEIASVLQLTWWERIFKVVLPSVVPGSFAGIKLAVTYSLLATLLVDILGSANGVGRLIDERRQNFDSASVWGLVAIIGAFGYLLNTIIVAVERRVLRNFGTA